MHCTQLERVCESAHKSNSLLLQHFVFSAQGALVAAFFELEVEGFERTEDEIKFSINYTQLFLQFISRWIFSKFNLFGNALISRLQEALASIHLVLGITDHDQVRHGIPVEEAFDLPEREEGLLLPVADVVGVLEFTSGRDHWDVLHYYLVHFW